MVGQLRQNREPPRMRSHFGEAKTCLLFRGHQSPDLALLDRIVSEVRMLRVIRDYCPDRVRRDALRTGMDRIRH